MGKKIFIANWKSNKTTEESVSWLEVFNKNLSKISFENKTIVICPSFMSLQATSLYIKVNNLPISLGAQNISQFGEGAYTGEVNFRQIREFCQYVIIGHSERRKYNHETDSEIFEKTKIAKKEGLKTIVCIQAEETSISQESDFVAYEPVFAIGTGNPDTPGNVEKVFNKIINKRGNTNLVYGGSVNTQNVTNYLKISNLSGFLIATASLDPNNFTDILSKC